MPTLLFGRASLSPPRGKARFRASSSIRNIRTQRRDGFLCISPLFPQCESLVFSEGHWYFPYTDCRPRIVEYRRTTYCMQPSHLHASWKSPGMLVAGSGIEPESQGYEPYEIPLLYPAWNHFGSQTMEPNENGALMTLVHCTRKTPKSNLGPRPLCGRGPALPPYRNPKSRKTTSYNWIARRASRAESSNSVPS